ncbi:MAG: YgiQ family radical SAM protein, partial [Firmicutes bacterium]|nr:YgiQ family radical SAM protein [Bacillota bacterium]
MFLPTTKVELQAQSIDQPDFIVVSADAYVDHPSFGHALIARLVQSQGFSVAVLPQPVTDKEFLSLGAPKHAFLLSAGVVDSMVNNYHVSKTKRTEDVYSDEGKFGRRPDRVTEVYAKALKRLFSDSPIIAGGIEPSLRRLAHYDYWEDKVRHSILFSAPCDLIIYGMGEQPILEILSYTKKNVPLHKLKEIKGTAYLTDLNSANKQIKKAILENDRTYYNLLSSFSRVSTDKSLYGKSFLQAQQIFDSPTPKGLIQKQDNDHFVVINPPSLPLPQKVFDSVYALPFMRKAHPRYKHIPALEEVQFSVTAHRGCFGNCSFCALTYHQGRHVLARSTESVLTEVEDLTHLEGFKGYIHDIGGPTANFHAPSCHKNETDGNCKNKECIGHKPCTNLRVNHKEYTEILRRAKNIKGVKKVFVRSGVRFDYAMMDSDKSFLKELTAHHVSGQLKVAPEHCSNKVLK